MPGLWKAWKAKNSLPTLSTSPLGISPKAGEIPTFPQLRRRRRMEKWKTKSRFSTFPPPRFPLFQTKQIQQRAGYRPPPERRSAPPHPATSTNSVTFSREATRQGKVVDAGHGGVKTAPNCAVFRKTSKKVARLQAKSPRSRRGPVRWEPRADQVVCQHFGDVRDVGDPFWRPDHTESPWLRTDSARLELVIRPASAFQKASQFVSGSAFASRGPAPSPVAFQKHKVLVHRRVS